MRKGSLFTKGQLKRFSNILDNIGQVLLASVVIPVFLGVPLDKVDPKVIISMGLFLTLTAWWLSLRLERISS